jgi:hypothetical protein
MGVSSSIVANVWFWWGTLIIVKAMHMGRRGGGIWNLEISIPSTQICFECKNALKSLFLRN